MSKISLEELKSVLSYNKDTGLFHWLVGRARTAKGSMAGTVNSDGYIQIKYKGKCYLAHRLAWLFETGEWPEDQIDHENRVRTDNRFDNLGDVSSRVNHHNLENQSEFIGVHKRGQKFAAYASLDKKNTYLGIFDTPEEAHEAYKKIIKSKEYCL